MDQKTIETLKAQIAAELMVSVNWVTCFEVDEENHSVDFKAGGWFFAKLNKANTAIRKNSVRRAAY